MTEGSENTRACVRARHNEAPKPNRPDDVTIKVTGILTPHRRKPTVQVRVKAGPVVLWVEVVRRRFGALAIRYPHGAMGDPAAAVSAELGRRIIAEAAPHISAD
jgi:creatinine amidohydrolase/Fe(II)-dependent formamide hydrolase-like protein